MTWSLNSSNSEFPTMDVLMIKVWMLFKRGCCNRSKGHGSIIRPRSKMKTLSQELMDSISEQLVESVIYLMRIEMKSSWALTQKRHDKKLINLSQSQEKPLRTLGTTVKVVGDMTVPQYVIDLIFSPWVLNIRFWASLKICTSWLTWTLSWTMPGKRAPCLRLWIKLRAWQTGVKKPMQQRGDQILDKVKKY